MNDRKNARVARSIRPGGRSGVVANAVHGSAGAPGGRSLGKGSLSLATGGAGAVGSAGAASGGTTTSDETTAAGGFLLPDDRRKERNRRPRSFAVGSPSAANAAARSTSDIAGKPRAEGGH